MRNFPRHALLGAGEPAAVQRSCPDEPPHAHEVVEIALVEAGSAEHLCAAGGSRLVRGGVVVVRPGAWHTYRAGPGFTVRNLFLAPELLRHELAWLMDDPVWARLLWLDGLGVTVSQLPRLLLRRSLAACSALQAAVGAPRTVLVGHLLVVLGTIAEGLRAAMAPAIPAPGVTAVLRAIEADPAQPWTLARLAGLAGTSPSQLVRSFRRSTGVTPMAFVIRCRVGRAACLLAATDRPVAAIADAVGWPDPAHFARRFRAIQGLSASAWRARYGRA
jgi:AraC family L-rhamnose operon transcriptional activator RhaR